MSDVGRWEPRGEGGGPGLLGTGVEMSGVTVDTERGPRIPGAGSAHLGPEQLWASAASTRCPDPPRREQPGSWEKGRRLPATQGTGWAGNVSAGSKDVPKGWDRVRPRPAPRSAPQPLRPPAASRRTRVHTGAREGLCGVVTVHIPGPGQTGITAQRMASRALSP